MRDCWECPMGQCYEFFEQSVPQPMVRFILMDYGGEALASVCHGQDLDSLIAYFIQISCGLEEMHRCGIIHRDITPDNIFVKGNVATLGDLGLSCSLRDYEPMRWGKHMGNPTYTAPERKGHGFFTQDEIRYRPGDYGEPADIYSLGMTMKVCMNGASCGFELR